MLAVIVTNNGDVEKCRLAISKKYAERVMVEEIGNYLTLAEMKHPEVVDSIDEGYYLLRDAYDDQIIFQVVEVDDSHSYSLDK